MNSKSSFSRRTWLLCSKRRRLLSSKRLSSILKIHTVHPSEPRSFLNAMSRDSSPPLSSYFQRRLNRGAPTISLDEKTVEFTCKIEGSTLRVAFELQKTVDQKRAQRLEHRAALPPSPSALWLSSVFFCCTSLIMSPSALVRNVPYTVTSRGGPVEEDSDEHEGTSARRGIGAGEEQDASVDRCGKDTGVELPADEETLEAVSRGRSEGSAAPQCGKRFEPREAGRVPA